MLAFKLIFKVNSSNYDEWKMSRNILVLLFQSLLIAIKTKVQAFMLLRFSFHLSVIKMNNQALNLRMQHEEKFKNTFFFQ